MSLNEKDIINDLEKGEEGAYIQLFREYYVFLCAYSRKYVGRKDVAEEIVSDVFFRLWANRKTIKIKTSIKSYLFKAVFNNSMYFLRTLEKENKLNEFLSNRANENIEFSFSPIETSEQSILKEEFYKKIELAIDRLPPKQQEAFKLKRFEGKKIKEISEIMDLSVKTVEMHLSKALINIRKEFNGSVPDFLFFYFLKQKRGELYPYNL
ncbi:MAG: RNA polymerase sigma-70 factor [Draconibacterium sp.]